MGIEQDKALLGNGGTRRVGSATTPTSPSTTAIVLPERNAVQEVQMLYNMMAELKKSVLKPNIDYGVIPGTGAKPTLLLPGMEKIMRALYAVPEYIERRVICDYDKPLFHYEYECRLMDATTSLAIPGGRGLGLCTSMESAFRYRQTNRKCPSCGKEAIIKGKEEYGGGWLCFRKKDGCGAKFEDGDQTIEGQATGRIENPDIFDQVNAIMKRAKKRALGDAVKGAAAVSEFFTVDLEDFTPFSITAPKHEDVIEADFTDVPAQTIHLDPARRHNPTPPQNAMPSTNESAVLYVLPEIIDQTAFMYDAQKHCVNSVNKLIAEGKIAPVDSTDHACVKVLNHRAESVYEFTGQDVLDALSATVNNEPVIARWTQWVSLGKGLPEAWEAIKEYREMLANEAPAQPVKDVKF